MGYEIKDHTKAKYFVAYGPDGTRHVGRTDVGQVTITGQPDLIEAYDANDFLSLTESVDMGDFNPLPEEGESVNAGEIYTLSGKLVIARQDHIRTFHDPADVPALFSVYRENPEGLEWIANESVMVGDERTFGGTTYRVVLSHTTQVGWEPDITPALWNEISGTQEWVQPTGAHDAYPLGAIVTYQDLTYESIVAANVWAPDVFGWIEI